MQSFRKARRGIGLAALAASGLGLAACGSDNNSTPTAVQGPPASAQTANCPNRGTLTGAGSTFQAPMQQAWIKSFCPTSQVQINYAPVGSGTGITDLANGTVDFAGSDVVMKPGEQTAADKACGSPAVHLPVTAGGVAVIYHLPGIRSLRLSAKTTAEIFTGKIKSWNDPEIAADGNTGLPSTPISVFYRSDSSGTTAVFTGWLTAAAGGAWTLGAGKTVSFRAGQGASGSQGVAQGVAQTAGGISYVEQSYAQTARVPSAAIRNHAGHYVRLTSAAVTAALAGFAVTGSGSDLAGRLDFASSDPSAYPISTVSYVITCARHADAAKRKLLAAYLTYTVNQGQQTATGLGFAPLSSALVARDRAVIAGLGS